MHDYRKLAVWQSAHELVLRVYRTTSAFPDNEKYGLISQARRAAASVPANIAEGSGRHTQADYARFCSIALGSLNELEYHLLLARDLSYLPVDVHDDLAASLAHTRQLLFRFMSALRS